MNTLLDPEQAKQMLTQLEGWKIVDNGIEKEFNFSDFKTTFAFMGLIAQLAEQQNHHPDWYNSYNHLLIILTSHDKGGLTERDFILAKAIDQLDISNTQ